MGSNRTGASDKFTKNRVNKLRRSTLIVPGNMEKYLSKAFERGADAVQLDLEDSISREHKAEARNMVASLLQSQLATEAEINVRINHDELFWSKDLEAVVLPRLNSLTLPKCEDPEWIFLVDQQISKLEKERDIAEGSIELSVLIESAKGLHGIDKLLDASPRISTVTLGNEDFCLDLGIEPSSQGEELITFYAQVILNARVHEVMPLGMVSSISNYQDLERFRMLAMKSKQLGFMGSSCIHPAQIAILNEAYMPSEEEMRRAAGIIRAFDEAQVQGRSSCSFQGMMVDPPIYQRAVDLLGRANRMMRKKANS
jgi:citrate lyase subunit beta/citryl-CoA lyase